MSTDLRKDAQQDLIDYLNQEVDPYDFQYFMPDWNPERAEEVDNVADALTEAELKKFTQWLRAPAQRELIMREVGADAPSYLFFTGARPVPKGAWFIHFTNETPFRAFEYGAPGEAMGLTVHFRDRKRNAADCDVNMSGELGPHGTIYGFAFDLEGRDWRVGPRKYGRNAVIFQHDYAVTAHHSGDEEHQVIFPICGEYNVVPVYDVSPATGGGLVPTNDGDVDFDSWQDIVAWVEQQWQGQRRKSGLGSLHVARRYWAPGVYVKRGTFLGLLRR